jgi:hypothetical protein
MQPSLNLKPISETLSFVVGSTVKSLPSLPSKANKALIQVTAANINVSFGATTSTTLASSSGLTLFANDINKPYYEIEGWDLLYRMRMWRSGSTDSNLSIIYLGEGQPE